MTTTAPRTEEALHQTASDLRGLGSAVKQDFADFRETARTQVNDYSRRVVSETNNSLEQVREYTVQNPLRALGYAVAGGVVLGLFFRR
jgi:ElaB/YqjD/DUF883 family membrane-anchored ribosome-binding protein